MDVLFFNPLVAILLACVTIFLLWVGLDEDVGKAKWPIIVGAVLVFLVAGAAWSVRQVYPNQRGVVINAITADVGNTVLEPGMHNLGLFGNLHQFPAASEVQLCNNFTPSVKGGYGVVLSVCYYANTTQVNWVEQYRKYNTLDYNALTAIWFNKLTPLVASTVKDYNPQDLTDRREAILLSLAEVSAPVFTTDGVELGYVSLVNWDFTSPEIKAAFDKSAVANTLVAEERAKLAAAEKRREREMYEAETANAVASQYIKGIQSLGMKSEDVMQYLTIRTLIEQGTLPQVVISVGGSPVSLQPVKAETK